MKNIENHLENMYEYTVGEYKFNQLDKVIPDSWRNITVESSDVYCNSIDALEEDGVDMNFLYHHVKKHFQKLWITPKDLVGVGNLFLEYLWGKESGLEVDDYDYVYLNILRYDLFGEYSDFSQSDVKELIVSFGEVS